MHLCTCVREEGGDGEGAGPEELTASVFFFRPPRVKKTLKKCFVFFFFELQVFYTEML
jgi:hypothetical protein